MGMSAVMTSATVDDIPELQGESQVVLINHMLVTPENAESFLDAWAKRAAAMKRHPGILSAQLRGAAADGTFTSVIVWESAQAFRDALRMPGLQTLMSFDPESVSATNGSQRGWESSYAFGTVSVEPATREVRKNGNVIRLTFKEFELLVTLLSHPRRVFSREELMDRVWGYRATLETGTLTVHMRRLREKLEEIPAEPRYLQTVWGVGYRFVP
jgi:DNA-binding response OmpR family regulator